jgi:hypothetical protein
MTKIAGSGSGAISQRHGSAYPDLDPHQTFMDRNTGGMGVPKPSPAQQQGAGKKINNFYKAPIGLGTAWLASRY